MTPAAWVSRWNADAARIFAAPDHGGLSLSNHAEPIFRLWDEVAWQRTGASYILNHGSHSSGAC